MSDEMDELLRGYAPRWQAAQAPPAALYPMAYRAAAQPSTTWRWLPVAAVAGAVLVVIAGVGLVKGRNTTAPLPAISTTTTSPTGLVPFVALPPTGLRLPTVTLSPSPDPGLAKTLRPCRASDLHVSSQSDGAGGTRFRYI